MVQTGILASDSLRHFDDDEDKDKKDDDDDDDDSEVNVAGEY